MIKECYRVSPFIDQFVDMKVSEDSKKELFEVLALYYDSLLS
jgi:hypothetical protein